MIRISKITVQKKMKQRYNVYVDEKGTDRYSFSVDEDTLIKFGMRKGLELNEDEIKEIVDADEAKKRSTSPFIIFPLECVLKKK